MRGRVDNIFVVVSASALCSRTVKAPSKGLLQVSVVVEHPLDLSPQVLRVERDRRASLAELIFAPGVCTDIPVNVHRLVGQQLPEHISPPDKDKGDAQLADRLR